MRIDFGEPAHGWYDWPTRYPAKVLSPGRIIAVAALAALVRFHEWEEWVNVALGAWLVISPWVLGFTALVAAFWNILAVGIVVLALALWSAYSAHTGRHGLI